MTGVKEKRKYAELTGEVWQKVEALLREGKLKVAEIAAEANISPESVTRINNSGGSRLRSRNVYTSRNGEGVSPEQWAKVVEVMDAMWAIAYKFTPAAFKRCPDRVAESFDVVLDKALGMVRLDRKEKLLTGISYFCGLEVCEYWRGRKKTVEYAARSLDAETDGGFRVADAVADPKARPPEIPEYGPLATAAKVLCASEASVVQDKYFGGMTNTELARARNLSRERIRQLEASALKKLRHALAIAGYDPYND